MSDAARLARQHFLSKPQHTPYARFAVQGNDLAQIASNLPDAILSSAYSAVVSYTEALSGLKYGSASWGIVRLYYSCFYSIRAMLIASGILPFNGGAEMLLDTSKGEYIKGGRSSHHWNWASIKSTSVKGEWYCSNDSQSAYEALREHRENVNYTHGFTDPNLHACLTTQEVDLGRRFRAYRDDDKFFYTYLPEHLAVAYPTRLLFHLDKILKSKSLAITEERSEHLKSIWKMKDRCPLL